MSVDMETCPASAPFFGFMGVTSALVFANIGAAYGTAKSGVGISSMGVMNPGLVMRNIIPVVMAGVLGIYGLIVAVIIQGSIVQPQNGYSQYSLYTGFAHLAAGLCCGLSGLAAGMAIGIVGDAGVRAVGQQEKLFVGMILILIFAEALGLYGTFVASAIELFCLVICLFCLTHVLYGARFNCCSHSFSEQLCLRGQWQQLRPTVSLIDGLSVCLAECYNLNELV